MHGLQASSSVLGTALLLILVTGALRLRYLQPSEFHVGLSRILLST